MSNTIESIEQGNRLIAEFMGAEWRKDDFDMYGYYFNNSPQPNVSGWWDAKALKYRNSWDWLMTVVEKIESDKGIHFQICEKECNIWNMPKLEPIVFTESNTKIEAVYNAVIEFIKWYNNQKSNQ